MPGVLTVSWDISHCEFWYGSIEEFAKAYQTWHESATATGEMKAPSPVRRLLAVSVCATNGSEVLQPFIDDVVNSAYAVRHVAVATL
jgi:hypothetical protein